MSVKEEDMGQETEADSGLNQEMNSGEELDNEETNQQESNLNTNYDSSDGAIPMHRCDLCDYETMSRPALISHMISCQQNQDGSNGNHGKSSNGRKMFECDVCNMRFSNGANMRRHKMRHTGVKPYECRVCGKRFFRKDHLAEHTTTHAKSLPWSCPICQRGFQRQIAMRAHFQNEHVGGNGTSNEPKSCPLCSYKAGSMKSLRVHFYNRHGIDLDKPSLGSNGQERSIHNATPPMHFLTPHIEISTQGSPSQANEYGDLDQESPRGSPESGDSTTPSSSIHAVKIEAVKIEPPTEPEDNSYRENEHAISQQSPVNLSTRVSPLVRLLAGNIKEEVEPQNISQIQNTSQHTCGHCGIRFPDRTLYFLHKGCHAEANPWKCNICGEQTKNVYDFNSHLLSKNHQ